ncbi:MAG TPA: hypothetical protein K8V84_15855 [Nocardiopsis listeri]|uniref:hypothetical protein n=1 Tax=Nocardiopsis listeri TaxID=53440 RepID=UPI001D794B52|nr:hypothetical protein [Nocardiopsis listeri]HJE59961.1 hypothetical protein [Nocardiopsis listeri]
MNKVAPVIAFVVFMLVFVVTRTPVRNFLESWVALEGVVLGLASMVASAALAALVAGAILYVSRILEQ